MEGVDANVSLSTCHVKRYYVNVETDVRVTTF